MGRHCCVKGCHNNSSKDKHVSFHNVPAQLRYGDVRKRWIEKIRAGRVGGRSKVNSPGQPWQPGSSASVCSLHFVDGRPSIAHPDPQLYLNGEAHPITRAPDRPTSPPPTPKFPNIAAITRREKSLRGKRSTGRRADIEHCTGPRTKKIREDLTGTLSEYDLKKTCFSEDQALDPSSSGVERIRIPAPGGGELTMMVPKGEQEEDDGDHLSEVSEGELADACGSVQSEFADMLGGPADLTTSPDVVPVYPEEYSFSNCPACIKGYKDASQLQNHLLMAHSKAPESPEVTKGASQGKIFECEVCSKLFTEKKAYMDHVHSHIVAAIKPVKMRSILMPNKPDDSQVENKTPGEVRKSELLSANENLVGIVSPPFRSDALRLNSEQRPQQKVGSVTSTITQESLKPHQQSILKTEAQKPPGQNFMLVKVKKDGNTTSTSAPSTENKGKSTKVVVYPVNTIKTKNALAQKSFAPGMVSLLSKFKIEKVNPKPTPTDNSKGGNVEKGENAETNREKRLSWYGKRSRKLEINGNSAKCGNLEKDGNLGKGGNTSLSANALQSGNTPGGGNVPTSVNIPQNGNTGNLAPGNKVLLLSLPHPNQMNGIKFVPILPKPSQPSESWSSGRVPNEDSPETKSSREIGVQTISEEYMGSGGQQERVKERQSSSSVGKVKSPRSRKRHPNNTQQGVSGMNKPEHHDGGESGDESYPEDINPDEPWFTGNFPHINSTYEHITGNFPALNNSYEHIAGGFPQMNRTYEQEVVAKGINSVTQGQNPNRYTMKVDKPASKVQGSQQKIEDIWAQQKSTKVTYRPSSGNSHEKVVHIRSISQLMEKKSPKKNTEESTNRKQKEPQGVKSPTKTEVLGDRILTPLYYKCDVCPKRYERLELKKMHMKKEHFPNYWLCDFCDFIFPTLSELDEHKMEVHLNEPAPEPAPKPKTKKNKIRKKYPPPKDKKHLCDICGYAARYRYALRIHKETHTGEKNYTCDVCGKKFTTASCCATHRKRHSEDRSYSCTKCPKTFKDWAGLKQHLMFHNDERPFPCDICGRSFHTRQNTRTHRLRHFKNKVPETT